MTTEPLTIFHTMKGNKFKAFWQSGTSSNTRGRIIKMQSIYEYLMQKLRSGYSHRKNNH